MNRSSGKTQIQTGGENPVTKKAIEILENNNSDKYRKLSDDDKKSIRVQAEKIANIIAEKILQIALKRTS